MVFVGHVDHGKSSLIGRLVAELSASVAPVASGEWSHVTDGLSLERNDAMTIRAGQTFLRDGDRTLVLIDVPGHMEFLQAMLTGAAEAHAAVLVVDVTVGPREQTGRHLSVLGVLGFRNVILAVNKMDLVDNNAGRFEEVIAMVRAEAAKRGLRIAEAVPVSAATGANLVRRDDLKTSSNGQSLLDILRRFTVTSSFGEMFSFPVQDVLERDGTSWLLGRVESGQITEGDDVVVLPEGACARVVGIGRFGDDHPNASVGDCVALALDGVKTPDRGKVIAGKDHKFSVSQNICGRVLWLGAAPLGPDAHFKVRCTTQASFGYLVGIGERVDTVDWSRPSACGAGVCRGELAEMEIALDRPMVVDDFARTPSLGRFIIERRGRVEGVGTIALGGNGARIASI